MITVILEYFDKEIDRYSFTKGEDYLLQNNADKYPLLSELSLYSYDVFASNDMEQLIVELRSLNEAFDYNITSAMKTIITLAEKCSSNKNYTLTFTPFNLTT